jgi:lysophospholipase L1-like esterase
MLKVLGLLGAISMVAIGCTPQGSSLATTASQSQTRASTMNLKISSFVRLVIAGDSIGAGNIVGADPWARLDLPNGYEVKNHSVSGSYLGQHAAGFGYQPAELADYTDQYGAGNSWLIIQAGTNDLAQGAPSSALYQDNTVKMIQDAHRVGFRVLVATILPRNNRSFGWTTDQEGQRRAYNDLVRRNSGGADAIADLASDSVIGSEASTYDNSLFADGLHPTGLAYERYIEPVYSRALAGAGTSVPGPSATPAATPAPTPGATPAPTTAATPATTPVPTATPSSSDGLVIYQSSPASISAGFGQSVVPVNVHLKAVPLDSPFYQICLSLVNANGAYVDQSGGCVNPPQRSDIARGDEDFVANASIPARLQTGVYAVVVSYMQWTGGGWMRAKMAMGPGVSRSPESGNIDPNQYAIAMLTITNGGIPQPTPVATPAATPQPTPGATPQATPQPTPVATPPPTTSGFVVYRSSPDLLSAVGTQSSVSVNIRYNAQPLNSPFYSPCLSLVDASGRYVDSSGACFAPPQRSDIASGLQSFNANFQLPPSLASGRYTIVLSYMQWTGMGWQRAALMMGDGVTRSPEVGNTDPNQYAVATLGVQK